MDLSQSLNNTATKRQKRYRRFQAAGRIGFDAKGARYLIVRLPDPKVLIFLARSVFLACFIVSFPWLRSALERSMKNSNGAAIPEFDPSPIDSSEVFATFFHDLSKDGLLRTGHKALFLSSIDDEPFLFTTDDVEMDQIHVTDIERQSSIQGETFDFIFTHGYDVASEFIDRTLKLGGVLAIRLSKDPLEMFEVPASYKIVYFRKFGSPILAMRKLAGPQDIDFPGARRKLLGLKSTQEKRAALQMLEDVLLEPPRAASGKSRSYIKKTRYLPDLMGDSLESYPRRVFIAVEPREKSGVDSGTIWFTRNYPTRNLDFDIYRIETVAEDQVNSGKGSAAQTGMSDWLRKNVRKEEYVVMKAEAEVVEEMVKSKSIRMVDELFLDCKPRRGRRAYWECLALYGKLRDEGVAVHQWWG